VSIFLKLAPIAALALAAQGQSVVSTRSGIVHFFEGSVAVAGQPLERHFGKFPMIPEGAELRTEQGRAEVLLTPGVILRVGERSAIRMASNALADTRVELLDGAAIVDSDELSPGTSMALSYKNWTIRFQERGAYRIDSDPPQLWVQRGEVQVSAGAAGQPVSVAGGMRIPFASVLVPEPSVEELGDGLTDWARGRSQSIYADNAISSQISDDPASMNSADLGLDSFTYFPMLGLSPAAVGLNTPGAYGAYGAYGVYGLYQPGFNSLYLPGYAYRPLILMVGPGAFRSGLGIQPLRISPGLGTGLRPLNGTLGVPTGPVPRVGTIRPVAPIRPAAPGVRGGRR
jgi:hypothetical protein